MVTAEQIRCMPPGRELDTLIAKYINFWEWHPGNGQPLPGYSVGAYKRPGWVSMERMTSPTGEREFAHWHRAATWSPSRRIADAWEVLEDLLEWLGGRFYAVTDGWVCAFGIDTNTDETVILSENEVEAPTAPLAICRAALLTVMEPPLAGQRAVTSCRNGRSSR